MENNIEHIKKRINELSERTQTRSIYTASEFMTLSEQSVALEPELPCKMRLVGGYDEAERRLAFFGSLAELGWEETPPISIVEAQPLNPKFADELSHRDYLGALMSLGIRREVLGDIVVHNKSAYIFCLESIADFIVDELTTVRHTNIKCQIVGTLPPEAVKAPEPREINAASERFDCITAAVFGIKRDEVKALCARKLLFINGSVVTKIEKSPAVGDIISLRGYGRFRYNGISATTRKGRLKIAVDLW